MIVRFFNTGTSNGESPVGYLLRMRDHQGNLRPAAPELLAGSPQLTIDLINGICRKHKYSSGCLAFRAEEQPTRAELFKIIDRFKAVVAPGLSEDQFNSLFVIHQEAPDRKTGVSGFHVHFVLPMTLLGGKTASGKDMTGKRWNPHPPGARTIETMALFTKVINHEHGWKPVQEKPMRVSVDSFWRKADRSNQQQKAELLRQEISRAVQSGELNSRQDLLMYLDETLGLTVTRSTATSVSVKFPGSAKAVRLKGPLFEDCSDYVLLCKTQSANQGTERLSVPEYEQARQRLEHLLNARAKELQGLPTTRKPHKTTTRKERVYGKRYQEGLRGDQASRQELGRLSGLLVPASSLERNLLQAGAGQWRDENVRSHPPGHAGPQETSKLVHHVDHASERRAGSTGGRWRSGGPITAPSGDIDQKIWSLAVQLNDCEVGSYESAAILAQLNVLQGERERIARSPKPKR